MSLVQYCQDKIAIIETELEVLLPVMNSCPAQEMFDSMRYSIFAGGKRLRPILFMAAADAVGGNGAAFLNVACSLEMIHTYSLIHDDLPAMDNDDYRRGKLTNHKVYGEGMAILAGDGLLTLAFEVMATQKGVDPAVLIWVIREISQAAGPSGMVGGQVVDLYSEGKQVDFTTIRYIHEAKTGAMFKAALRAGAYLAGATPVQLERLTDYAENFGLAFQITDDILDVIGEQDVIGKPVGSDIRNHKATYVSLYTLDGAKKLAQESVDRALFALNEFGSEANILRELVSYLLLRKS